MKLKNGMAAHYGFHHAHNDDDPHWCLEWWQQCCCDPQRAQPQPPANPNSNSANEIHTQHHCLPEGRPFLNCVVSKRALPVEGGGVNAWLDGLEHFFSKWAIFSSEIWKRFAWVKNWEKIGCNLKMTVQKILRDEINLNAIFIRNSSQFALQRLEC